MDKFCYFNFNKLKNVHLISSRYFCVLHNITRSFIFFHPTCLQSTKEEVESSFKVIQDFINEEEEELIVKDVEPHLKRQKYQYSHWDDAIHGFRETEKKNWSTNCAPLIKRLHETSFKDSPKILPQVHVLDLSSEGVIKPHIDSVRFCGNIISGLCLLSNAVMRLKKENQSDQVIDIFLPRRCLYIMRDDSRYKYTHEILSKDNSYFGDKYIEKDRRISVICRNPPS